jgi:hypothetical protein
MSKVVEFVGDVVGGVADAVGDVVDFIGDAIGDVIDFVVDDIIRPVVNGIGDVIQYALDNPIEAIAKVAAIATGQLWAIPLIDGAAVLAKGGDFGDAVKAAAISYVATTAGNVASTYTSAALKEAGVSATVSNIVSAGTKSATTALVYGQDPLKAFAVGGLQAGVAAGLGEISSKMEEQFGSRFENLRGGVKDSIFAGVAAELEGGNVSSTQMGQIINKYTGVAGLMEDFLQNNAGFSEAQAAIITNALSSAVSTAIAGNPNLSGEAFFKTISNAGAAELKKIIDKPVNNAIDKVSGAYRNVEGSANALNDAITKANTASERYNGLQANLNGRIREQDRLKSVYDNALAAFNQNETQANADAVNNAAKAFNDYASQLERDYNNNFKDQLAFWESEFNKYNNSIPALEEKYQDNLDWMVTETENLDVALQPSMDKAERAVTLTLRPNFDEDAYRKAAGLGANEDVYSHFLSQGQNLPTDAVSVDQTLNSARGQIIKAALANQGVDLNSLEYEQQQAVAAYVVNNVRSLTDITGMNFDALAAGALQAANDATPMGAAYPQSYGRASGVTDTDIVTGAAELSLNGDTWEWQKTSTIRDNLGDTNVNISRNNNGTLSADIENRLSAGEAVEVSPGVTMRWTGNTSSVGDGSDTLQGIVRQGLDGVIYLPEIVVSQINDLNEEAGRLLDEYVGEPIWEATSNLYNTYVKGTTADAALRNTASIVAGASGELLQAASGLALLAGANPDNAVGRLADQLLNMGENLRTEGYQASVDTINETIGNAEGWREKAAAIWDVATSGDTAAVFFAEYVGKELLQEIPILLASGGAGNVAKRALQEAGEQVAKNYAARVGVSTAIGLDMAEAFGGTAAGAYDEAYATALKVGMSEAEANEYAIEVGQKAGAIATVMVGVTAGIGGAAFEKAILGDGAQDAAMRSMYDAFKDRLIEGGTVTIKEGITEGIEEALPQFYVAMSLSQIDPTYDVSGEVMASALLGKIAGAGTAAGIYTGDSVADALFSSSAEVQNAIQNAGSSEAATQALQNLGINDNLVLNNLLNTSYDQYYVSTGEAGTAFQKANPDFQVDQSTVESFVGKTNESQLQNTIDQYVDARYLDADEAKALAAAQGVTITDEQAQQYVQQGGTGEISNLEAAISAEYDPQGVTFQEAKAQFEALGFTPTDAQVRQFIGEFNESEKLAEIAPYVDPRQVTEEEARQFYADLGYTPTNEEIQQFVGQGNENYEQTAPDRVNTYVDPRQVTEEEARQFFADLGYEPTDEQVANFVAQVEETAQQGAISRYVDPRQVTMAEVQQIADEEGLTLTEALAQTYIGQGQAETFQQERLAEARAEYDPLATTQEEATQFFADTGYNATIEEIVQFVASKTEEAQTSAIGAYVDPRQVTAAEAEEFLSSIGYQPSQEEINQFVGQMNDANYQVTQQAAIDEYVDPRYFDAGEIRAAYEELGLVDVLQEDVDRFIAQYDPSTADYGVDEFESTRLTELQDYFPAATFNVIREVIGSPAVEDNPNTEADESKDATGIYAEFEAGATRDEALQSAIDQLATELGVTKDEVLDQIGLTEETLGAEIDAVAEDVTAVREEVTGLGEQITGVEEQLGEQITGVEEQLGAFEAATGEDLQFIADIIGKPARDVTQTDVDFVADLVAQQQVLDELSLEYQQYDVNNDGVLDINDQTLLEQSLAGQDVQLSQDSAFVTDPTGVYEALYNTQQDIQTQMEQDKQQQLDAIMDMNTQINTQLQTNQRMSNVSDLRNLLMQQSDISGQRVAVKTPDPMRINYLYDFSSIFANPQQASLFPSPYAKGGQVEDTTDKLLRIIGGTT